MTAVPLHAGPPLRKTVALATCIALAAPGCAVRTWTAEPQARVADGLLDLAPGETARVTDDSGTVEIEVAECSLPFLTGRARPGTARVAVDLGRARSVDVQTAEGTFRRGLSPVVLSAADLAGRDVELAMPEGPLALRATALDAQRVLYGQPLACREGRREVRCTGLVRVDLREARRVEVKRRDASASLLATLAVPAAVLLVLYAAWTTYWRNYDK